MAAQRTEVSPDRQDNGHQDKRPGDAVGENLQRCGETEQAEKCGKQAPHGVGGGAVKPPTRLAVAPRRTRGARRELLVRHDADADASRRVVRNVASPRSKPAGISTSSLERSSIR